MSEQKKKLQRKPAVPRVDASGNQLPPESKAEKFKRLANHRVNAALKRISQLPALANKSQYECTPDQVSAILKALDDGVMKVATAFAAKSTETQLFSID